MRRVTRPPAAIAAAREAARRHDGQFGVQHRTEAAVDLAVVTEPIPNQPVYVMSPDAFMERFAPGEYDFSLGWDGTESHPAFLEQNPINPDRVWAATWGEFCDDIARNGIREPVEVDPYSDELCEGHHRVIAAAKAGRPIRFHYDGDMIEEITSGEASLEEPETPAYDWRDQSVTIEGRQFTGADVYGGRLFHGSIHDLPDGTTLEPGRADANFKESDSDAVSLTSGANTAFRWATEAAGGHSSGRPRFVYEVEPLGPIHVWRAMLANYGKSWRLQEGRVPAARIVRRIDLDDARGYESALIRGENPLQRSDKFLDS